MSLRLCSQQNFHFFTFVLLLIDIEFNLLSIMTVVYAGE